jgi:drug/metabolite transporter (DMT)-like permease
MSATALNLASPKARGYLLIHLAVVLFGFTPIMGRLITLHAVPLVWWRMALAAIALLLVPATWKGIRQMPPHLIVVCCGTGVILAISWSLFYLAVKLANASVGAVGLATAPLFVAAAGPILVHRPYRRSDVLLAVIIVPGIALVVGGVPRDMGLGLFIGIAAAAVLTIFSGLNKYLSTRTHPLSSTCLEFAAGAVFLIPVMALAPSADIAFVWPGRHDLILLVIFAVALTAIPIVLLLLSLRSITVFAQQMAVNLEPVYAVLLAIPILGEQQELGLLFYLGVIVIVGAVMVEPLGVWLRGRPKRADLPNPS